jgi:tRNA (guanine37-N1)-methyltransferase
VQIVILTGFPSMFDGPFGEGMIRIARERGALDVRTVDLRAFAHDKRRTIDDAPYGGGAGMILKPDPIAAALEDVDAGAAEPSHRILLGPQGERFDQAMARELAGRPSLVLVTGRYKDVDERVRRFVDREVSIGDYVLSGGELAAMVIVDAVARLLPGVVGDSESVETDSFESGRLDAPYYTRPPDFRGHAVPEVLRSGDHGAIAAWRRKESLRRTLILRPDLVAAGAFGRDELEVLREIIDDAHEIVERSVRRTEGKTDGEHSPD